MYTTIHPMQKWKKGKKERVKGGKEKNVCCWIICSRATKTSAMSASSPLYLCLLLNEGLQGD